MDCGLGLVGTAALNSNLLLKNLIFDIRNAENILVLGLLSGSKSTSPAPCANAESGAAVEKFGLSARIR